MADLGEPSSYLALEAGAPVFSCDGARLGRVQRIAATDDADIFDGIVIATALLGGSERYVKAEQIEEIFERGVLLKIDAEQAAELPKPGEGDTPRA